MSDLAAEILAEVRRTFRDELERTDPIEPEQELAGDLELDSIGALVLAVALEDHFRVTLDDADAAEVRTVADLVALVEKRVRGQRAAAAGRGAAEEAAT
jgi:acyl carrier protein